MGKRKERRLAAMMSTGRRVKLDLFAEPSGELGGSPEKDEVGKDVDAKLDAELHNSPSSSGQQLENPLSLLGQYSDEELDEGSNEAVSGAVDDDNQGKESIDKELEEGEVGGSEDLSPEKADNQDSISASGAQILDAHDVVALDEKPHEANTENQNPVPVPPDTQPTVGVSSCWKMVLHEESDRYYYWNTVTGQTSWEVPDTLAHGTGLANEIETLGPQIKENGVSEMAGLYEHGSQPNQSVEECSTVVSALSYETSTLGNYSLREQLSAGGGSVAAGSYEVHGQSTVVNEQGVVDLPSHLIKHGEALLERLKLLQRSGVDSDQYGQISKHVLEIEIRLSDFRSLLPYGSSLSPFWLYSERQLNCLEESINIEIGKLDDKSSGMPSISSDGKDANPEDRGAECPVDADMRKLSAENSYAFVHDVESCAVVQQVSHDESSELGILNAQQISMHGHPTHLKEEGSKEIDGTSIHEKASSKPEFQSGEDVDMDIDMEVEDPIPVGGQLINPSEESQPSAPITGHSLGPGSEFIIPPPPEEEWIPPPPPDDEGIPPPPPDEPPPESLCPPQPPQTETELAHSIYSQQYSLTYPEPSMNYYDNTSVEVAGSSLYEHAGGAQIAALNLPVYYATVSNVQPTAVINPVDSFVYCGLQNGGMPVVPVESTIGSSVPLVTATMTGVASSEVCSTSVISALPTSSAKEHVSVPSVAVTGTSSVVFDASTTVSKTQSKASRMKKPKVSVGSSLRSNKKVSSLVDKWKAAKEEFQDEEEEEPETALEILEKKRRRQIEEWRAQQIASGEAKENANFQPLGGDWRERVKRRRAQKEGTPETSLDAADNGTKQPDLNELSRDLPPGWQAYWDDSSRQVYYGNSITSETSWTRPTR